MDLADHILEIQTSASDEVKQRLEVILFRPKPIGGLVLGARHRVCADQRNAGAVHLAVIVDLKLRASRTSEERYSAHLLHAIGDQLLGIVRIVNGKITMTGGAVISPNAAAISSALPILPSGMLSTNSASSSTVKLDE